MGWLLAVHCGAGRYGGDNGSAAEAKYVGVLRAALKHGQHVMQRDHRAECAITRAVEVVTAALSVFERSEVTNCGRGSNLTEQGLVECEASAVCGRSNTVTACACVRGVAEPSSLARELMERAMAPHDEMDSSGREPPLVVVGESARQMAAQFGLEVVSKAEALDGYQVTASAKTQWTKWRDRFRQKSPDCAKGDKPDEQRLDTVGAICVDPDGNVAAALSSGGILYKVPGRVGLAGCPRVGCNAKNARQGRTKSGQKRKRRNDTDGTENGYAFACTGRGEHFLRSSFASTLSELLRSDSSDIEQALSSSFESALHDNAGISLEGGVIALSVSSPSVEPESREHRSKRKRRGSPADDPTKRNPATSTSIATKSQQQLQLGVAFTTSCMGVGFVRHDSMQPHVQILRQPTIANNDLVVHVSYFSS